MKIPGDKDPLKNNCRIGILTAPTEQASVAQISNLIEIFKTISNSLLVITGNAAYDHFKNYADISCYNISHPIENNNVKKIFYYLYEQFRGSLILLIHRDEIDLIFFFSGGEREVLPILTANLLKKPTLLILTGNIVNSARYSHDPFLVIIKMLNWIACNLVSGLILYSPNLISQMGLERHKKKIFFAHEHFLDFEKFKLQTPLEERSCLIGYIGRLSKEKGILNFIESLSIIFDNKKRVKVVIGGTGPLLIEIENYLKKNGLRERVDLVGWISHNDLPHYLNKLQLLIIPSYTEGLSNIMLEAMACGTPVLATSVGAVPDVIKDGETGFIMENNSPECIAENIIRSLSFRDLNQIGIQGRDYVIANYSLEKTVEDWKPICQIITMT